MYDHTARAVAYICGRLVGGEQSSSVYDYADGKYYSISGTVEQDHINVYDYQKASHISGTGSGGNLSLYHYGDGRHLTLKIDGDGRFSGYDYATGSHYTITTSARNVSLYDYEHASWKHYSI